MIESVKAGLELAPVAFEFAGRVPRSFRGDPGDRDPGDRDSSEGDSSEGDSSDGDWGDGDSGDRDKTGRFVLMDGLYRGTVLRFGARVISRSSPKALQEAMEDARAFAERTGRLPIVIGPFFSADRIATLERADVSGVDLCGNGVLVKQTGLLVLRTGQPNTVPASSERGIRNLYRGAAGLVARAFLACPRFDTVQQVRDEITRLGGKVSLATVSKAMSGLEEDLIIERVGRSSALRDGDALLENLSRNFRPPTETRRKTYRFRGDDRQAVPLIAALDDGASPNALVRTGASSVDRYSVIPADRTLRIYCRSVRRVESAVGDAMEASVRFPDLELIETRDDVVFLDRRPSADGVAAASPVQCWLELREGDKRQQDAETAVRERIMKELAEKGWPSR